MRTTTNYSLWFTEATAACAREAFRAMCQQGGGEWYLYYRPHGLAMTIAQEAPEGYVLATGERVPGNRTVEGMTAWVRERMVREPVLPVTDR